MKKLFVTIAMLMCVLAKAQTTLSLRYLGLTVHPFGDQTASIQPHKLDDHAFVVLNFGGVASIDHYFFYDQLAVTLMQGAFTDCSGGLAGFSHLGIRGLLWEKGKHRLLLGIGPMLYYRQDWNRFPEYEDGGVFRRYHSRHLGDVQYKIFWIAGEFAWHWQLSESLDFNFGFTPGIPLALTFSAGVTYWPKRFSIKLEQPKIYFGRRRK